MSNSLISNLNPQNWSFDLELLPQPVYMVGGVVRDAILGRSGEYLDLDFVVPSDAIQIAGNIAKNYQAGFVILDPERKIARVVFPDATVDIAQQEGDSLETDLRRRDFTVNAIAYNPHTQEFIDPLQGCVDLENRTLRMVSSANLKDDPLRLLRAYRQGCQLGFTIEESTQIAIRTLASHITQVAAERVRVELGYLLASENGTAWLKNAWEDGLITPWFKYATMDSFSTMEMVDVAVEKLTEIWQQLGEELHKPLRNTIKTTLQGIAKLACLVNSESEIAKVELEELTYSRVENRGVTTALKLFPQLHKANISLREQYFLFQEASYVFPAIATLAMAHGKLLDGIAPLITRYLNPDDLVAHPAPLMSGKEIIIALNIPSSPVVGQLLTEIAVAQAEGKIVTKEEGIELARQLVMKLESKDVTWES
ncbi:MAG: CCA tRNA nucleotidyltransferase [Nostocaceae cyanobacterium]|nr:CCA tRNA nucleotidyltransferase [Nostocaceae cyanobacterium]